MFAARRDTERDAPLRTLRASGTTHARPALLNIPGLDPLDNAFETRARLQSRDRVALVVKPEARHDMAMP